MKARIVGFQALWLAALLSVFMAVPAALALPDAEVKALMSISPAFKAAEEEIVAVWQKIPNTVRQKLKASQTEWVKTVRDQEAKKLMEQGYSFAQAYTRVTRDKTRELRQSLPAAQIKRAEYMALEPNDDRSKASVMSACGETLLQYFHQTGDVDWTRFHARRNMAYRFLVYPSDPNLKITLQVFGTSDQPMPLALEKEKEGGAWVLRAKFDQTGFYYLKAAPAGNLAGPAAYEIAIRGEACP